MTGSRWQVWLSPSLFPSAISSTGFVPVRKCGTIAPLDAEDARSQTVAMGKINPAPVDATESRIDRTNLKFI